MYPSVYLVHVLQPFVRRISIGLCKRFANHSYLFAHCVTGFVTVFGNVLATVLATLFVTSFVSVLVSIQRVCIPSCIHVCIPLCNRFRTSRLCTIRL